jgi:hypothetical protein
MDELRSGAGAPVVPAASEFYVGYLPAPPRYRRFVRTVAPLLLLVSALVAVIVSASHEDPGTGTWDLSQPRAFEGIISTQPYAMIRVVDETSAGRVRTLLLVQEGKFGALGRIMDLHGRPARVRGFILERDGWQILELESTETAVQALDSLAGGIGSRLTRSATEALGAVALRGEIIDPKCYFGAMKPGDGKQHKECATLCIAGGIPPMFTTRDAAGRRSYYLLADPAGRALDERILPFVADPVEISGMLERRDDLTILRIDPGQIRRR